MSDTQIEVQLGKEVAVISVSCKDSVAARMLDACTRSMGALSSIRGENLETLTQAGSLFDRFRSSLLDILRGYMTEENAAKEYADATFEQIIRGLIHFEEVHWAEVEAQGKARVN